MHLLKSLVGAAVAVSVAQALVPGGSMTYAGHRRALSRRCDSSTPHNTNGTGTPPPIPQNVNGTGTPPPVPENVNGTATPPPVEDTPTPTTTPEPSPTPEVSPPPEENPAPKDPVAEPVPSPTPSDAPPAEAPPASSPPAEAPPAASPPPADAPPADAPPADAPPADAPPAASPAPSPTPTPAANPPPADDAGQPPAASPTPTATTPGPNDTSKVPGSPLTPPGQPTCSCQICHPGVPQLPSGYDPQVGPVEKQFDQLNSINIDADVAVGNLVHIKLVVKILEEGLHTCEGESHEVASASNPSRSLIDLLAQVIVLTGPTKDYCEKHVPALIDVNGSVDVILGLYLDLFVSLRNILQIVLTINVEDRYRDDLALLVAELDLDLSVIIKVLLDINILGIQIHAKVDASVKVVLDLLIQLGLDRNDSKLQKCIDESNSSALPGIPSSGLGGVTDSLPTKQLTGGNGGAGGLGGLGGLSKGVGGLLKRMDLDY